MKARVSILGVIILTFVILLASASAALACEPPSAEIAQRGAWCNMRPRPAAPTAVPTVVAAPTAAPIANTRRAGLSPLDALPVTGEWQTLEANSYVWYKIDNGNNYFLDVWLDAHGRGGVNLAMYAPTQANDLSPATPPKGRGTPTKNEHDLYWSGFQAAGVWHALVTNSNSFPVQYRVGSKQASADRQCVGYWEYLPTGEYVYWVDCGKYRDGQKP